MIRINSAPVSEVWSVGHNGVRQHAWCKRLDIVAGSLSALGRADYPQADLVLVVNEVALSLPPSPVHRAARTGSRCRRRRRRSQPGIAVSQAAITSARRSGMGKAVTTMTTLTSDRAAAGRRDIPNHGAVVAPLPDSPPAAIGIATVSSPF